MKFKLSGGNRNASCTLSEKWEGEILYAALHVVLAEEAVPEKIRAVKRNQLATLTMAGRSTRSPYL